MNHACIKFSEGGNNKVMVLGGVTESEDEEFRWEGRQCFDCLFKLYCSLLV